MGSNGLTSARHDVFEKYLATKYPESFDAAVPEDLIYSGQVKLTDAVENSPIDAGQLVLSPTRTYAPIIKKILDKYDAMAIHGMVHCSGGANKNSSFRRKLTHHKGQFIPVPLFTLIQEQSKTDWKEMYQVLTVDTVWKYTFLKLQDIIAISKSFHVDAQIVGRVEAY
jgi:phosphoribosylformylglycinamidine cyclo-ligase